MNISAMELENDNPAALVLCGGGSRGAMEVGFYEALTEANIRIDMILGSSIGALNGAYIAGGMDPADLALLWRDFRLRRAITFNWALFRYPRRRPGIFSLNPLRTLLQRTLPVTRFEDLPIPLTIVTTDLEAGHAVYWQGKGDLIEPMIASMSLPGIFPPVEIDGRMHVDGGITNNTPLDKAGELGARSIYMIECVCAERCPRPLRGWADVLMRSFSIALDSKYRAELNHLHSQLQINTIRPQLTREVGLLDFQYSAELIAAGYQYAKKHFTSGRELESAFKPDE